MNIEVSKEWANAMTREYRTMRRALEQIVKLSEGRHDRKLRQIHDLAASVIVKSDPVPPS